MVKAFLIIGGILAFLSVALGAFAAHALKSKLTPDRLAVFQTGAQYQMYHALALLLTGMLADRSAALLVTAGWFFVIGIILFSGSLYALAASGIRKLGAITPLGGLSFLIGWLLLVVQAISL
ncbi:DUF423 domain-containing protein [Brevibacillus sp. B_LB10_24]|uniref:DUF423 domain-containing protein n=1 Tax=Brevibacillus sp. B_LB10_24 TaxID=3380645 RepID=UPI0038B6E51D